MAGDLPSLPVEILLHVIRSEDSWKNWSRRILCEALRLTCKELNAKTLRYYGSEYYKQLNVRLTKSGLQRLLHISKGELAYYVQSIVIDCDSLLNQQEFNCSSQSSGFSKHDWWDGDSNASFGMFCFMKISFDDGTMDLLKYGGCADLLGRSLSMLPHLRAVCIQQPHLQEIMKEDKWTELQSRWSIAVQQLLTITLSKARPLEFLSIRPHGYALPTDPIALRNLATFVGQLAKLRALHLNLALDDDQGRCVFTWACGEANLR